MNVWNVQGELNGMIFFTTLILPMILTTPALLALAIAYIEGSLD
jgi:hypothetical protein